VNFLLQAGSFQDKLEADERRAKITLLNMSAEIVPGVVAGRTWYRVQVGPFNGRNAAEDARKHLSASNIDSIPLLMR
jgi:cell division protein FtsN